MCHEKAHMLDERPANFPELGNPAGPRWGPVFAGEKGEGAAWGAGGLRI